MSAPQEPRIPAISATACWACGEAATEPSELADGLLRCPACGLEFAPERRKDVRDDYGDEYFARYAHSDTTYDDPLPRAYEAKLRLRFTRRFVPSGRLLEIGAASGWFLAAATAAGYEACGIEPGNAAAAAARARGLDVVSGFVEDVDLERGAFDGVCAWHVLEHIPDPGATLQRLAGALKRGGALLLEVPNADSAAAARLGAAWPHLALEHHVAHYGLRSLEALLTGSGLQVIHMETVAGSGYFPPRRLLRPGVLAGHVAEAVRYRALPRRPHPTRHELLRAVAVPAAA